MSIINSIETARRAKINDDAILSEIVKQNPSKATVFEQAKKRGASSSDIINEVIKQNSGLEKTSIIEQNLTNKVSAPQPAEEKKDSLLSKVGKFFTGATQKFTETLGTAASVIDPTTKKLREETISSAQNQSDQYLKMAQSETDKDKKDKLLKAASYLADTEDIDIYNNPEYQKTAKQIYGEAIGVAAETLGWGKIGNIAKTVKASTVLPTVLKSAGTGAVLGGVTSTAKAMEENKSTEDIIKSSATGTVVGGITGGALGYGANKLFGKIGEKQATKLVSAPITKKSKELAYRTGRASEASFLKSEKILPTKSEQELGKLAQDVGLKIGKNKSNISKVNTAIEKEAEGLKQLLKETGAVYNKNNVKGQLNKMKSEVSEDLVDSEVKVYDKMVAKFNKMVEASDNKGLDGLLEVRQKFDQWLQSNNPNIFINKQGGVYRASKAVRESVNGYINKKVKNDIVVRSLKKQTDLYKIRENISKKSAGGGVKLKSSTIKKIGKKLLPAALYGGATALGVKAVSGGGKQSISNYSSYLPE